jgi:hypothetical protein
MIKTIETIAPHPNGKFPLLIPKELILLSGKDKP